MPVNESRLAMQMEKMHGSGRHLFPGVKSGAEVNVVEANPGMEIIGLEVANSCQHSNWMLLLI